MEKVAPLQELVLFYIDHIAANSGLTPEIKSKTEKARTTAKTLIAKEVNAQRLEVWADYADFNSPLREWKLHCIFHMGINRRKRGRRRRSSGRRRRRRGRRCRR